MRYIVDIEWPEGYEAWDGESTLARAIKRHIERTHGLYNPQVWVSTEERED